LTAARNSIETLQKSMGTLGASMREIDSLMNMDGSSSVFVLAADGKAQRLSVKIKARGVEGAIVDQNLADRKVIVAKPDILLRVATGVPVVEHNLWEDRQCSISFTSAPTCCTV
jgi:hypothetical protein